MSDLSKRLDALSPEKLALLSKLLKEKGEQAPKKQKPSIPRRSQSGSSPLSLAQHRLWFLSQLHPESSFYNMAGAMRLTGHLSVPALEQTLSEIVRRHEVLRASFPMLQGKPVQIIAPTESLALDVTDISDLPATERENVAAQLINEESERPFNLARGPLHRTLLLRLKSDEHLLLVNMHHIVGDGWSIGVFLREMAVLYQAFSEGLASPLPELSLQYGDYASWQEKWLKEEALDEQLAYWKRQLQGCNSALDFVFDYERPANSTHRAEFETSTLSPATVSSLEELSRQENVTLFMTMLAAFYVLLYRYTGQEDINLGSPIVGRNTVETEELIGFFINSLVLRGDLSGNPSFQELLQKVREMVLDAQTNQDIPFERIVEALQPERSLVQTPLFQAVFRSENMPTGGSLELQGLTIAPFAVASRTTEYDLIFSTAKHGEQMTGTAIYSADLFNADTIKRLLDDFRSLLEGIIKDPRQSIRQLNARLDDTPRSPARAPMLSEAERHQVLVEWNDTRTDDLPGYCFHELFEAQVERFPNHVAAIFEDEQLTYRELNARANQLARYLRNLGVGPDVRVGICVERSLRMLVGLIGIMKAGGAYLPLDPSYPLERLSFMLEDAQAPILLSEQQTLETLPVSWAQVICLDDEWETISAQSDENLVSGVGLRNLAYVIYTSGSTGRPKGVMVEHGGLRNLAEAQVRAFAEPPEGQVLQFASLSFDASIFEIVMALRAGATICLGTRESLLPGSSLLRLLRERKITNVTIPPSILSSLPTDELPALRTIIVAGEACSAENVARWSKGRRFFNAYGPTETTVWATVAQCADPTRRPSIGRPVINTQIYLLDQDGQPVPVGAPGELYIGGDSLARGYLNRPELTAERFVPDPYGGEGGARLYRTGDLARYLVDGQIEFLGRIDHQVKLRGLRIELGEIESLLSEHPQLRESIVLLHDGGAGDSRLVAYIVPQHEPPSHLELRDFLGEKLPDYMIPSVFVTLDALPLTVNGKIDHRALPSPDTVKLGSESIFVAPRNRVEEILAGSWSQVLDIERVGIDDNFFVLGGDSIRSVQVLATAQERGLEVTLQQLFKFQTIRQLAEHLRTSPTVTEVAPQIKAFGMISDEDRRKMPDDVEDAYPLTLMQAGMLFQSDLQHDDALYHAVNGLHLRVPFDQEALQTALQHFAALYSVMRTSFDLVTFSEPLQLVHQTVRIPLLVDDLREFAPGEQERAITDWLNVDKYRRFDLAGAPLLRFHIHRRTDESLQFTFTAHHAIFDGWSDAVFLTELLKLYLAIIDGATVAPAPPLGVSFRDYVGLERAARNSEESRQFWLERLMDTDTTNVLGWPPPTATDQNQRRFETSHVRIPVELGERLNKLARSSAVPLKSVLLAAHLRVMVVLTGQTDVVTGLVSNGRPEAADGDRIIGLFLNTLPFRAQLNGGTWEDLIREAFEGELQMVPHRRYPLAQIQFNNGGQSLFDTCFNYTHFHVYQSLEEIGEMEVLGSNGVAETEFAVMANFNVDLRQSLIELLLICDATQLGVDQIKVLPAYYMATLEAMASDPRERYDAHSPITPAERSRLLLEWNNTAIDYPNDITVHQLFEAQVKRSPHALAVVYDGEQLSYQELNGRANQLARHLREMGVGVDARVGICLRRSLDMVVAVLGVFKAGAAYVPLDPAYPQERLALMLDDSQVEVLLTQQDLISGLPAHALRVVSLDSDRETISRQSDQSPDQLATADNLAYVIYTSGSTGRPKGVAMPHRPLVNLVQWQITRAADGPPPRTLQFASLSFDVSFQEIFCALCAGASLVLISEEARRDGGELLRVLANQQVERLCLPFVALNYLAEAAESEGVWPQSLRQIMSAGEQLKITKPVRRLFENLPGCTLDNQCGPSETHAIAAFMLPAATSDWPSLPPIGRPVANTQLYVLDAHMELAPMGVPGELYIGGEGLSRGYLNRADLTAERFVPHPFSKSGERLYRSGDVVRYLPTGDVEYLGRQDAQVKIRGFRIELGEIEIALGSHDSVRDAAVIVREDEPGDKRLVAYIVQEHERSSSHDELRRYLQERLPDYMLPSAFVLLPELPLTPSGKVNRRALPAPEEAGELGGRGRYELPRTAMEELMSGIWADVLKVREVGVTENFFELGGHSLLAIQLISRVRKALRVEVSLQRLFDRPNVRAMAEEVEEALRGGSGPEVQLIERMSREGALPVSFAQQRLWFIDQLEPASATYNLPATVRLKGQLDVPALERTLTEIVRRHEVLRTTFSTAAEEPVQVIHPAAPIRLELRDLSLLPESEREAEARRLVQAEAQQPFDLAAGPLLRASLIKLQETEHVVQFTMHHIVTDGWSMGVLIREMAALYQAFVAAQPSPLPELEIQYADFAAWQRQWLQGATLEKQLTYWRDQLAGAPAVLELPTDHPRPPVQSHQGATHSLTIPAEVTLSLKQLSRREGVTLFMTLLAAWQTLLSKYSGQEDIVVGSPIAGRNRAETESLIGFFVNTLVLRTDLRGDPGFRDLLQRVRAVTLGAYAHQDLPFEKLVEELRPERSLSHAPLFQVLFTLQNTVEEVLELAGLQLSSWETGQETAKFDLTLAAQEVEGVINCSLEYQTDLFDANTIAQMLRHFARLLDNISADADQPLSQLQLMTDSEREQLLYGWNQTSCAYPLETPLPQLFEQQVARTPQAIAVSFTGEELSYAELNARANRLAHYLRAAGVSCETPVGLLLERSVEMIVALLGVWKAGGAYVPLDPDYPEERLRFMVRDASIELLLTQDKLASRLAETMARSLSVDAEWPQIASESDQNLPAWSSRESLAYIIYTSGSSGTPKGAMVTHGGVVNCLQWMQQRYELHERDGFLLRTSLNFDPSVWEVCWPLLVGGRVVIAPVAEGLESTALLSYMAEQEVTCAYFVPSLLGVLVKDPLLSAVRSLRYVISGGEKLSLGVLREFGAVSGAELHHSYGPTETSIAATEWTCEAEAEAVLMGSAIGNTQVYVLDGQMAPLPVGVLGELYIGGAGVGRGYVGQAGLTAERFVPDPFGGGGGRLYRTGDVVKYHEDGKLEFSGRVDEQVKLRGYRIELGEIETVLRAHEQVSEVVVVVREEAGDKRLIAYVVAHGEGVSLAVNELREHLRTRLPEYMVPATFVELEQLPLLPNGKINRRALPAPVVATTATALLAELAPEEELVAGVFARVLGLAAVGVGDNFFELGGHSLLATQVVSRLRETFGVELALRKLFEEPTAAGLGSYIREQMQQGAGLTVPEIKVVERGETVPLSYAQQRLWFLEQLEPGSSVYNMPLGVRLSGELRVEVLAQTLTEIVRRHEVLRTRFEEVDGEPRQVIAAAEPVYLPVEDLSTIADAEAEVERQAVAEARAPFDLSRGPLLRVRLLRLSETEHVVLLTMHHIISDGWSMGVLVREVAALYEAHSQGEQSPLAELPVQYADYAVWQREWLRGAVLEEQLQYWRERLGGEPGALELPTDYVRPPRPDGRGGVSYLSLSAELTEGLKRVSREHGVTLFMTLLAAWQALLSRYSGQQEIAVGTPIAGRQRGETEGLIGFFVNTLVLRTSVAGNPTFAELLKHVREVCLGAYAHQDVPFEKLVEELQPERDLSRTPLFQVLVVMQNAPQGRLELPGLELSPVGGGSETAKFDLMLSLTEGEEGLTAALGYRSELFREETVARMLRHWERLLGSVVADEGQRLSELQLLSSSEREQLLYEWNETGQPLAEQSCIQELFEQQVARTPQAIAVSSAGEELSYAELNARANQLAHYLRTLGVGPEVLVGIFMERSVEMIVALLGVWKAGCAYVPLDPSAPRERVAGILRDAGVGMVLTQERLRDSLPQEAVRSLCLDQDAEGLRGWETDNPAVSLTAANLAYVIYTSGSTGQPKGVMVQHRSVVNLVTALRAGIPAYQHEGLRVSVNAPLIFDGSVKQIVQLLSGHTLCVVPEEVRRDGVSLREYLEAERIAVLDCTPAQLGLLLAASGTAGVQTVLVGGEAIDQQLWERLQADTGTTYCNVYGPTECTVDATVCVVQEEMSQPSLGRPLANIEAYVVDAQLEPTPVGVTGELLLGGASLARGYLLRPELTAEKFIPDPFASEAGARLYRTGDLVRYQADGQLKYVGRADEQVKLRGYRIELGEIETVLRAHEQVSEAVVVVREDVPGDKRLVAYVMPGQGEQSPSNDELRSYLQERLPKYMIPSAFVLIDEMPVTSNGKVDRRALLALRLELAEVSGQFIGPRDALELQLVQVWKEILNVRVAGVRDNFFDHGGHSLLAVRLLARIRRTLGVDLPLALLFQKPTIEHLAAHIRQQSGGAWQQFSPLVEIQRGASGPVFFCVHPSGGNVLCYAELAKHLGVDQAFYGLQARGLDATQVALTSIDEMATSYIEAIRTIQPVGPYFLGGWSMGGIVAFEMAQQLHAQGQHVSMLALIDTSVPTTEMRLAEPDEISFMVSFARDMGLAWEQLQISRDELVRLNPQQQLAHVLELAMAANVLPPDVEPWQILQLYNVFKTNVRAMLNYAPQPWPGQITFFKAEERLGEPGDSQGGWEHFALQGVELLTVPGNHYTMVYEPHVRVLARGLAHCMANETTYV